MKRSPEQHKVGLRFGHTSGRKPLVYRRTDGSQPPVKRRHIKAALLYPFGPKHPLVRWVYGWSKGIAR